MHSNFLRLTAPCRRAVVSATNLNRFTQNIRVSFSRLSPLVDVKIENLQEVCWREWSMAYFSGKLIWLFETKTLVEKLGISKILSLSIWKALPAPGELCRMEVKSCSHTPPGPICSVSPPHVSGWGGEVKAQRLYTCDLFMHVRTSTN